MATFILNYSSGIKDEVVDAPNGIQAYIASRFGHHNEYLALGGKPPVLVAEVVANVEPDGGVAEPVEATVDGTSDEQHGTTPE